MRPFACRAALLGSMILLALTPPVRAQGTDAETDHGKCSVDAVVAEYRHDLASGQARPTSRRHARSICIQALLQMLEPVRKSDWKESLPAPLDAADVLLELSRLRHSGLEPELEALVRTSPMSSRTFDVAAGYFATADKPAGFESARRLLADLTDTEKLKVLVGRFRDAASPLKPWIDLAVELRSRDVAEGNELQRLRKFLDNEIAYLRRIDESTRIVQVDPPVPHQPVTARTDAGPSQLLPAIALVVILMATVTVIAARQAKPRP